MLRNYSLVLNFPFSLTLLSSPPLIKALIFQSYLIYRNPLQLICNQSAKSTFFLFFMFSIAVYLHMIFIQDLRASPSRRVRWFLTSVSSDKDQSLSASPLLNEGSNQDTSISWNCMGIRYDYRLEAL